MRATALLAAVLLVLAARALPLPAQAGETTGSVRLEVGVQPEQVTVGDPFRVALRVRVPAGTRVVFAEVVDGDSLQAAAPMAVDTADAGAPAALFTLVAWIAGAPLQATVPLRIIGPDGVARLQTVALPLPEVVSVLPAAGEPVAPRPAKGLVVPSMFAVGSVWWWLAVLLGALAALLAALLLLRRQRDGLPAAPFDSRAWAAAQLSDTGAGALLRTGDFVELHRRVSRVLRVYVSQLDSSLGPDLTTTELLAQAAANGWSEDAIEGLREMLGAADRVKFAAHHPAAAEAEAHLAQARGWVEIHPPRDVDDHVRRAA